MPDADPSTHRNDVREEFFGCGASYDPVFWSRDLWPVHVQQMKEAGLSFVRLFEFSWCRFEPKQETYCFEWADEFLHLLDQHNIQYLLCTPGAAPPSWLTSQYPETVIVHADGQRDRCETRRHGCPSSEVFMTHCLGLAQRLAKRYGHRKGLIGWQIDNELGHPVCYCDQCEAVFRDWIMKTYGSVDEMNRRLGTIVWSHEYDDISQVRIPQSSLPGLQHAFRRWTSDRWITYIRRHVEVLRPLTDRPLSTNMMAPWHGYDHFEAARLLDVVGMDYYPYGNPSVGYPYSNTDLDFLLSYTRAIANGRTFWMLETEAAGFEGIIPPSGRLEEWTLREIAHGANLVNYFRWDTPPFGVEELRAGIVGPGEWTSPAFAEIKRVCDRVEKAAPALERTTPEPADIAVLFSYPSWWKFLDNPLGDGLGQNAMHGYPHLVRRHCHGLTGNGLAYDIVGPDQEWDTYRCLIVPHCVVMDVALAQRCRRYVERGGTLLMTAMSGIYNEHGVAHPAPYPFGALGELCGVRHTAHGKVIPEVNEILLDTPIPLAVDQWADQLQPSAPDVQVLISYRHALYEASPALTRRREGDGEALYLGAVLAQQDMRALYSFILPHLGITNAQTRPVNVWSRSRINSTGDRFRILQNTGETAVAWTPECGRPIEIGPRSTHLSAE